MDKEPLHTLIHTLNKSEKRYFKLYCSIQQKEEGEEMNYLKLFEFLEEQEEYNEDAVIKKFEGEAFLNQLHVTKNYLYNLILKSLRGFFHEALPELVFSNQMQNIEILYSKGLFKQCLKQLNKVEKMAEEAEDHIRLMQVYRWRLHLMQRHDEDKTFEKITAYWGQLNNEAERYKDFITIRKHAIEIFHLISQHGVQRNASVEKKIDTIIKSLKTSGVSQKKNLSERAKYNLLNIDLAYYAFKGDGKNEINTLKKTVQNQLDNHAAILNKPQMFSSCLANLAIGYTKYGHYQKAMEVYHRIKNIYSEFKIKKTIQAETIIFSDAANTLLELVNKRGHKQEDSKLIEAIKDDLSKYKAASVYLEYLRLYFNLANYCFIEREYKLSNKFIQHFMNEWKEDSRNDLFIASSFIQLCIFYENKELDQISYALPRIKRKLLKLNSLNEVEKQVLTFFDRIINESSEKKTKEYFLKLSSFLKKNSNGQVIWLESFDLAKWLSR